MSTLLPVIWDRPPEDCVPDEAGRGGTGRLLGHIAIANDQWKTALPGAQALAIVRGPQAYISPSWYESKARHGRVVPTWNYEAVHLTGSIAFHQDPEWLRGFVTRLTRLHEGGREHPWAVTDAPPEYIDGQLRAIVGVELTITAIEAKQKLSQNRSELDREGVVAGLQGEPGAGSGRDRRRHGRAARRHGDAAPRLRGQARLDRRVGGIVDPDSPSHALGQQSASPCSPAAMAVLIAASWATCSGLSRSNSDRRTCSTWAGAAAASAAKPASVSRAT